MAKKLRPQFKAKNQTPTPNSKKQKKSEYLVILNQRNLAQAEGRQNQDTLNDVMTENGEPYLPSSIKAKENSIHKVDKNKKALIKSLVDAPLKVSARETLVPSKISFGNCAKQQARSRMPSLEREEREKVIMSRSDLRRLSESLEAPTPQNKQDGYRQHQKPF